MSKFKDNENEVSRFENKIFKEDMSLNIRDEYFEVKKLNLLGEKNLRSELSDVLNEVGLCNLNASHKDSCFLQWLDEANNNIDNGRLNFEINSFYTKNKKPYLINFSKDMICLEVIK